MLTKTQLTKLRRTDPIGMSRLRAAMKLAGVTQVRLAAAMGLSQNQISKDAAGHFSEMSLDKARAYARVFGCTADDLFPVVEALAS